LVPDQWRWRSIFRANRRGIEGEAFKIGR
jgi:hypothetical protein